MSTVERIVEDVQTELQETTNETEQKVQDTVKETSIPEKFKGKSLEDVIGIYENLEKHYGKQGQEVGQLRAHVTQLMTQTAQNSTASEESETNFYDDPEQYISRMLDEKLAPIVGRVGNAEHDRVVAKFNQEYPDWQQTISNPDFQNWVAESPVRLELHAKANQADYNAGKELLSNWETQTKASKADITSVNEAREKKLKDATTEVGSTGQSSGKIYNRHELINMRRYDREKYEAMEPLIIKAYKEGRVRD